MLFCAGFRICCEHLHMIVSISELSHLSWSLTENIGLQVLSLLGNLLFSLQIRRSYISRFSPKTLLWLCVLKYGILSNLYSHYPGVVITAMETSALTAFIAVLNLVVVS